jgi:hypothetical protein
MRADEQAVTTPAPRPERVQRKLIVGPTDDPAEHDADRFADQLLGALGGGDHDDLQRGSRIRRRVEVGAEGGGLDDSLAQSVEAEASGGLPLAPALRTRIERATAVDLGAVRVHPDSDVAPRIGASAFTHGSHIHFAAGRYQPESSSGVALIAHEVGHVVQQGGAPRISRMWDIDKYDAEIPKHKGWLIQDQIRDDIKRYFAVVKKYPKRFKTRQDADQAFTDASAEARRIIDIIRSQADIYRKGLVHEADQLVKDSPEEQDLRGRVRNVAKFFNYLAGPADDELRAKHHDAVMPLLVGGSGERTLGEKDRRGRAISGAAQGGVNTLGMATYAVGGRTVTGYTKMDRPNVSDPGGVSGISVDEAKMSLRSVATYKVSELLNLGLVPETALLHEEGKTGQLMAEAHGSPGQGLMPGDEFGPKNDAMRNQVQKLLDRLEKPGLTAEEKKAIIKQMGVVANANHGLTIINDRIYELGSVVADFDWWDPVLQRQLNALQFFDLLVGHADRHSGNYIVDFDPADVNRRVRGIKGIDNDDTWGKEMTAARMGSTQFSKTPMPNLVDVKTAVKFLLADWNQIRAILVQFTMTPLEIAAAQGRFTALQAHIRTLATGGGLAHHSGQLDPADIVALQSVGINTAGLAAPLQWGAATQAQSTWQTSYSGIQSDEKIQAQARGTALYTPEYK